MKMLIDAVRYQREKGLNTNRHIIRKFKDDSEALKEAAEIIRTVVSECIERNLPIDDALAVMHIATLNNRTLTIEEYTRIIEASKENVGPSLNKIRQHDRGNSASLYKKIDEQHKTELNTLRENLTENHRKELEALKDQHRRDLEKHI